MLIASAVHAQTRGSWNGAKALRKLTRDAAEELLRIRKVSLKRIPPVQRVTRKEYAEAYVIKSLNFMWGGDYDRAFDVFRALGMLPGDLKAKPFLKRYAGVMTAAAYDFFEKRIIFPHSTASRDMLVHELCHAMQDERHGIAKLMRTTNADFDRILAMGALLEGEATNVQLRYSLGPARMFASLVPYGTLRKRTRAYAEDVRRRIMRSMPDVPPNLIRTQGFIYDEGVLFVESLRRRELRWAAVDAAYRMPPRSTTQILHPEKYIAGEWPVELTVPNREKLLPGYRLETENTLGEFGMRLFLMTHLPELKSPEKVVEGWRGDRVFLYRNEKTRRRALAWVSTWESKAKAAHLAALLEKAIGRCIKKVVGKAAAEDYDFGARVSGRDVFCGFIAEQNAEAVLFLKVKRKTTKGRPLGGKEEKK